MKLILEEDRVANLEKYEVLDTPADGSFDKFTRMAAENSKLKKHRDHGAFYSIRGSVLNEL